MVFKSLTTSAMEARGARNPVRRCLINPYLNCSRLLCLLATESPALEGEPHPLRAAAPPCLLCSRLLRLVATESPALDGATTPLRSGPPPHHLPSDGPA